MEADSGLASVGVFAAAINQVKQASSSNPLSIQEHRHDHAIDRKETAVSTVILMIIEFSKNIRDLSINFPIVTNKSSHIPIPTHPLNNKSIERTISSQLLIQYNMRISLFPFLLLALFVVLTITSSQAQETATVTQDEEVVEAATSTTTTEEEPLMDFDQLLEEQEAESKKVADTDATVQEGTATATTVPAESNETVEKGSEQNVAAEPSEEASSATTSETESTSEENEQQMQKQSGPLVDLFGHQLYSLEMVDETHAQLVPQYTNEALKGKKVIGLYFRYIEKTYSSIICICIDCSCNRHSA